MALVRNSGDAAGPRLIVLVKYGMGVPMEEALQRADRTGVDIASNLKLSSALVYSSEWMKIEEAFPCRSGTMAAYEKPGKKLGKYIEYTDSTTGLRYVFPVPEEHIGKRDIALVTEHPRFKILSEGKNRLISSAEVGTVEEFPPANGWHLGDPIYDIPYGMETHPGSLGYDCHGPESRTYNRDIRQLKRTESWVGLVSRYYGVTGEDYRHNIYMADRPSISLGVAIIAAGGGMNPEEAGGERIPQTPQAPKKHAQAAGGTTLVLSVGPDELRSLAANAEADLAEISRFCSPEKLDAIKRLLQALKIKG